MKISTFPQYYFMLLFKGLGLGIIYLPRLDCITQYFDKKRPLVTGRSTSMHTQSFRVNIIKIERLSAKVLQICLRHRHLWLGNRNLHLCPTNWLVIVILTSSIRYTDVIINLHHDHHQAADHVLLANSAADLGRDLHGQLRLRTLLQAHPRMQGRANNDQILKQIMKKFWPIDSQFYYHDAHRILRLRLARLCCL